jgi:TonB family protein
MTKFLITILYLYLSTSFYGQTTTIEGSSQTSMVDKNENGAIDFIIVKSKNSKGSPFNVDQLPNIYGGFEEMKRFIDDHLIYPSNDFGSRKKGTVTLNFVVTKQGKPAFITVLKSISPTIDKEAIRLLKLIDWIPAFKNEKPINVYYELKIKFSLSKYKKQVKQRGFDKPLFTDLPTDTSFNVYQTAEQSPVFEFFDKTFPEYIYSKLEYPEEAKRQFIEGSVQLSFIVEPNGQVSNIKILNKGVGGGCDNEALRLIGLTKWMPAIRNKQYVRYLKTFTINFSLKSAFKGNSTYKQNLGGTME